LVLADIFENLNVFEISVRKRQPCAFSFRKYRRFKADNIIVETKESVGLAQILTVVGESVHENVIFK
jgi:hypothetical protein